MNFKDVAFLRVQRSWIVEEEEGDLLRIYEDRPGSGTLRLWTEEYGFEDAAARDAAVNVLHASQQPEQLGERTTLSYAVHRGEDDEGALLLHQWIVGIRTGENRLRAVVFTHTVEAVQKDSEDTAWELLVVELAVRGAHYPDAVTEPEAEP